MSLTRQLIILTMCLSLLTGSGCFMQPVKEVKREFYVVDYDAPALRLGRPVKAELWEKDPKTGKWRSIGKGTIPAGAYIKGRAPTAKKIETILEKEK